MQIRLKQLDGTIDAALAKMVPQWDGTKYAPGRRNNATNANPGSGDDESALKGYEKGSIWINTSTKNAFICVDSTVGAAVWVGVGVSGEPYQEAHVGDVITKPVADTVLTWGPAYAPVSAASFKLYLNGQLQRQGAGFDYTITGATLQTITWLTTSGTAMNMDASDIITFEYETLGL